MAIIGTLPVSLSNGTTADASQVMSDLNFIVNQVNANAVPTNVTSLASLTSIGGAFSIPGNLTVTGSATVTSGTILSGGPSFAGYPAINLQNSNTNGNISFTPSGVFQVFDVTRSVLRITSDVSGNLVAYGNITANSDERLKKQWEPLDSNFLESLAGVKSGTYTRKDTGERQAGVSAQDLRAVLPEAVCGEETLSVAYGQAALVACVELAKEVLRLRALLEQVK
ncbi:tail fiber domain-containing protein [Burkholderia stagnalis]|uniref:tail fiber domain-containing protein n=1 Tax=Burkholderia stagnalis TaxID=1503054 RepID=UPI000F56B540|nr:tail fiber domain-containing protein [Burkholderia stagnalis]RQQ54304.1 tail fiber domain-containing protein [Burkholderia stagnalis]RQY03931.1 tail fiber domain-containing protein [Burkholderia stagnalis]RQY21652.1 tail fiber domain-containing protein [Burkholderia stagnalis]RQY32185.1 tail fiber domain-containing protein [Burkholderia stagnalis]